MQSNEDSTHIPELKFGPTKNQVTAAETKSSKRFHSPRYISRKCEYQKRFFKSPNLKNKPQQKHQLFRYLSPKKLNKNNQVSQINSNQKSEYMTNQQPWFQSSISQIGRTFLTQKCNETYQNWFQKSTQNILVSQFCSTNQKNWQKEDQVQTTSDKRDTQIKNDDFIELKALKQSNKVLLKQNQLMKNLINKQNISAQEIKNQLQKLQNQNKILEQQNSQLKTSIKNFQNTITQLQEKISIKQVKATQLKEMNSCLEDIILQLNQKLAQQNIQKNSIQNQLEELFLQRNQNREQISQLKSAIRFYQEQIRKSQHKLVVNLKNTTISDESVSLQNQKNNQKYLAKFEKQLSYLVQLIKQERQINQNLIQQLKYRDISLTILKKKQLQIECKQKQIKKLKIKNRKLMDKIQLLLQEKQRWNQKRTTRRSSSHNKSEPKNINTTHKIDKFKAKQNDSKQKQRQSRLQKNFAQYRIQGEQEQIELQLSPSKQ